jgi:cytochrome c
MNTRLPSLLIAAGALSLAGLVGSSAAIAVDAAAGEMLARQSGCLKCHAIEKEKKGPAYRDVAAKYAGNAEAEKKLIHHVTSGERVKFKDGHEEEHKIVKSSDPAEIKNLVDWILSLPGGTKY